MKKYMILILIAGLFIMMGCTEQPNNKNTTKTNISNEEIKMEYFYGECKDENKDYCNQMNPIILELKQEFPDKIITIDSINLTERHTNQTIQDLETKYKNKSMLPGIPTYIINEKYYTAGAMTKEQLKDWICEKITLITNQTIETCKN